jgi:hypothetical protein
MLSVVMLSVVASSVVAPTRLGTKLINCSLSIIKLDLGFIGTARPGP